MDSIKLYKEIEELKELMKKINEKQQLILQVQEENYKTLMQRHNKLQENNEIADMRYQYLYQELKKIKNRVKSYKF